MPGVLRVIMKLQDKIVAKTRKMFMNITVFMRNIKKLNFFRLFFHLVVKISEYFF